MLNSLSLLRISCACYRTEGSNQAVARALRPLVNSTARECMHGLDDRHRLSEIEQQLRNMEAARESTHSPRSSASQTHAQCIKDLNASSDASERKSGKVEQSNHYDWH